MAVLLYVMCNRTSEVDSDAGPIGTIRQGANSDDAILSSAPDPRATMHQS